MSRISQIYTTEIYRNLKPLYANWEPSRPVALGDYGVLTDRIFIRLGNISQLGVNFGQIQDARLSQKNFTSAGSSSVKSHAKGTVPTGTGVNAKAYLEVNFSSERSVFFNAAGCRYAMIDNKVALGDAVTALYRASKWQRGWCVVTDLVEAASLSLAVSSSSSSSITFEAEGDVPYIDLADASIGLKVTNASGIGYKVASDHGCTPLFGLCRIKPRFLWFSDDFRPLEIGAENFDVLQTLENTPDFRTEGSDAELVFAQVD